jgi:hypothetical protein
MAELRRHAFLAGAAGAVLATGARAFAAPVNDAGQYGSVLDPAQFSGIQTFLSPSLLRGTYLGVDDAFPDGTKRVVLDNLPPVMAQGAGRHLGSPGTCESCSYGYGLGGYTASRAVQGPRLGWNSAAANNLPSAAWLYQWVHQTTGIAHSCPKGSLCVPYLKHLLRFGAPSLAQVPYNPQTLTAVPELCDYIESLDVGATFPGSERFIIGSFKGLRIHPNEQRAYVSLFTEMLRNRHAISFSGLVPSGYGAPELDARGVFVLPQAGFVPHSGHGQVIVGYDDHLQAFLVQNSMSAGWNPGDAGDPGRNGRIWYSYDAFFAGQQVAAIMFPRPPDDIPGTTLAVNARNAPRATVVNAIAHNAGDKSWLLLVLHATAPLNVRSIAATDAAGAHQFDTNVNELMRLGYRYIERPAGTFAPGNTYDVTIEAGRSLTYRGRVTLTG